jgi:hypothetical protein
VEAVFVLLQEVVSIARPKSGRRIPKVFISIKVESVISPKYYGYLNKSQVFLKNLTISFIPTRFQRILRTDFTLRGPVERIMLRHP